MKTKKVTKIFTILFLIAIIASSLNIVLGVAIPTIQSGGETPLTGTVGKILGIVAYICYAAAVIMLLMLGISYATASPEGKAEIKKTAVQYVIGAAIVFAAGAILQIIRSVATNVFTTT